MTTTTTKKKFVLTDECRYNYSEIERRLFSFLSEKKINSFDLAERCFGDNSIYGRINSVSRMRILMKKIEANKEPFRIVSIQGQRGPKRPNEYWLERV